MPYTNPLPAPAPLDTAAYNMYSAATASGGLDPHVIAAAATTSTDPSQAAQSAQAGTQMSVTSQAVDVLKAQPGGIQAGLWKQMDSATQQQFLDLGYKPGGGGGIGSDIGGIGSDIGNALSDAGHAVASIPGVQQGVHAISYASGASLRAVQHTERAASLVIGAPAEAAADQLPDTGITRAFSIRDWSDAWNQTSNGEQFLDPVLKDNAVKIFGSQITNLAIQQATGRTPAEMFAPYQNDQAQLQQVAALTQTPEYVKAVNYLNAAHVSPGRAIVGASFTAAHPALGNALSGVIDGTYDWFTDPLNRAGIALKAAKDIKYVANTPDDVQRLYDDIPGVRAAAADMASHVASNTPSAFLNQYGHQYAPLLTYLTEARADTPEKVLEVWKNEATGLPAIINGSPTSTALKSGGVLPYLNPRAPNIATKLQTAINWAEEAPARKLGLTTADLTPDQYQDAKTGLAGFEAGIGQAFRRIGTTVVIGKKFDPVDPSSIVKVRQLAQMFLPSSVVDKWLVSWYSAGSTAEKWNVYRSLMVNLGEAANYGKDKDLWGTYLSKFAQDLGVMYDGEGHDILKLDGVKSRAALTKNQLSTHWALPDFRQAYLDANKASILQHATGGINTDWMDKFMGVWRGLTLAHGGFGFRVALEEVANLTLRDSPISIVKGLAGTFMAKNAQRLALEREGVGATVDTDLSALEDNSKLSSWQREISHLPSSVVDGIRTPADLLKAKLLDLVARASGHIAPPNMAAVIDDQIKSGTLDQNMADVLSQHGYDHQNIIDPLNARTVRVKVGQKLVSAELSKTGEFRGWGPTEDLYDHIWYDQLASLAKDDWGREALVGSGVKGSKAFRANLLTDRITRVADKLESDPMWHDLSHRSKFDSAGRSVAKGEISLRTAAEDHARKLIAHVDGLVTSPRTRARITDLPEFASYENSGVKYNKFLSTHLLQNGKPPSLAALAAVDIRDKPNLISGPDLVPITRAEGSITHIVDRFFTKIISPQINWMSRQPQWWHFLADSYKAYEPLADSLRAQGMDEEHVMAIIRGNAQSRAINMILPYVHNPELRSQMSTLTRNVAPFWFAQEQFYKRWAKVLVHSPAAYRQAQLMSGGIRHSGFIHTDPTTNQQYFVYPGSQLVQSVLTNTLGRFMPGGGTAKLPFGLTGQLNMLSPGLTDRIGVPSFGPFVVMPMNLIKQIDPHMSRAINDLEGPIAAQSGYLKAILPTTFERALEFALPSSINGATHASAINQAIQAVEASGHGMGTPAVNQVASQSIPNPRPGDYVVNGASAYVYQPDGKWVLDDAESRQTYLNRIKNASRIILLTRLVYGFAAPASPETEFDPSNLHSDFASLMNTLPVEEAITVFLAEHPDATPETVFQTTNSLGGFLPATTQAMSFLDANPKLVSNHASAAVYFIPPEAQTDAYSQAAYTEQMQQGLRLRKDPTTFYNDIIYQEAANLYFAADDLKNQTLANGSTPKSQVTTQWDQFEQTFFQANPIFATQYEATIPGAEYAREAIMQDVGAALNDGTAPKNAQSTAISNLYQSYQQWQTLTTAPPGSPQPSSAQVLQANEDYAVFLQAYVARNPGVKPLVDRAIRPDLETALDDLAAQGQAVTF